MFHSAVMLTLIGICGYQQIHLQLKMLLEVCTEEDAILEPISPVADKWASTLRWVAMYAGIRAMSCFLATFQMWQASLEKDTVPHGLHKLGLAVLLS